jgi:hypothetical protein
MPSNSYFDTEHRAGRPNLAELREASEVRWVAVCHEICKAPIVSKQCQRSSA